MCRSQSWRGKSAVIRIYCPLTFNGYSNSIKAVKRQRNLGLVLHVLFCLYVLLCFTCVDLSICLIVFYMCCFVYMSYYVLHVLFCLYVLLCFTCIVLSICPIMFHMCCFVYMSYYVLHVLFCLYVLLCFTCVVLSICPIMFCLNMLY